VGDDAGRLVTFELEQRDRLVEVVGAKGHRASLHYVLERARPARIERATLALEKLRGCGAW
jgi:uncharacterized protein RhaS with RHS repeats